MWVNEVDKLDKSTMDFFCSFSMSMIMCTNAPGGAPGV